MSLETKVSEAITEAKKVFDLVKNQFSQWDKRVNDKVNWADKEIINFKNNFELDVVFKVEGDNDRFYPIIIGTNYKPVHFTITRDSVHWDSSWWGRVYYEAKAFTTHWGEGANFFKDIAYLVNQRHFIANRVEHNEYGKLIYWLRGGTTYRLTGRNITLENYEATEKTVRNNTYSILDDTDENRKLSTFNSIGV